MWELRQSLQRSMERRERGESCARSLVKDALLDDRGDVEQRVAEADDAQGVRHWCYGMNFCVACGGVWCRNKSVRRVVDWRKRRDIAPWCAKVRELRRSFVLLRTS